MNKLTIIACAISTFGLANAAIAEGHEAPGNSGLAKGMAEALSGGAATLGETFGGPGKGTASAVSGGGTGGWGNVGSAVAADGQVSNRGGTRGAKAD